MQWIERGGEKNGKGVEVKVGGKVSWEERFGWKRKNRGGVIRVHSSLSSQERASTSEGRTSLRHGRMEVKGKRQNRGNDSQRKGRK